MYYQHFGLSGPPFSLAVAPDLLYMSAAHREALAALEWGLSEPSGFTLLVGDAGTGKTTLVQSLLSRVHEGVRAVCLNFPRLTFEELLRDVQERLGSTAAGLSRLELLRTFSRFLAALGRDERLALIFDEAQGLSDEALEELRLLSNAGSDDHAPLQIVLVGQPTLVWRLRQPRLSQLNQRIGARAWLTPLSGREIHEYVAHRLRMKGREASELFSRRALGLIARASRGNPRQINVLCHNSLMLAYAAGAARVRRAIVRQAVTEYDDVLSQVPAGRVRLSRANRPRRLWRPILVVSILALLGTGVFHQRLASLDPPKALVSVTPAARPLPPSDGLVARPIDGQHAETLAPSSVGPQEAGPTVVASLTQPAETGATELNRLPLTVVSSRDPAANRQAVVVRPGDTLSAIALRNLGPDLTSELDRLMKANPQIANADLIHPGETIYLPVVSERASKE